VVAAPALSNLWRRWAWPGAALLAFAVLLALAVVSPQRPGSLGASEAGGPMRHVAIDAVAWVRVQQAARAVTFERADGRWQRDGVPLNESATQALQGALRLLHNTPPERHFEAPQSEFELATPSLTVEAGARDGPRVAISFGATNPIGLARYASVSQGPEAGIVLLPGDVHDSWLALLQGDTR
jgi:hypothetical protein